MERCYLWRKGVQEQGSTVQASDAYGSMMDDDYVRMVGAHLFCTLL